MEPVGAYEKTHQDNALDRFRLGHGDLLSTRSLWVPMAEMVGSREALDCEVTCREVTPRRILHGPRLRFAR
jgi:hypothetical protein